MVIVPQTSALTAPADRSALALNLTAGASVHVLSTHGPWTHCLLPDFSKAWIATPHIQAIQSAP